MNEHIVYLRTSTTEQTPEIQFNGCLEVITRLELTSYDKLEEQKSAYKNDDKREVFNEIIKGIKKRHINILIVWDLDRLYRNRLKLKSFLVLCKLYHCKVYSFRQKFLEEINVMPEPWNEIVFDLMIGVLGWLAEDESSKKSDRIKNAIVKRDNRPTMSYKGNKWGRKEITNKKMITDILELKKQKLSNKEISKRVYYYDKSNNRVNPSESKVCKTLQIHKSEVRKNE